MIRIAMGKQKLRYELINTRTAEVVVQELRTADSFWARFAGLQLRRDLPKGQGLLLVPCGAIHTCFMRFSLDLVFLDKAGVVLAVRAGEAPWKAVGAPRQTHAVLEVRAGNLESVQAGDKLGLRAPAGGFIRPTLLFLAPGPSA